MDCNPSSYCKGCGLGVAGCCARQRASNGEQEAGRYQQETSRKWLDGVRAPVIRETWNVKREKDETEQKLTAKIEWLGRARRPSGLLKSMDIQWV